MNTICVTKHGTIKKTAISAFDTNRKPQMHRLKIKAKKFVFYKLILSSNNANAAATVTSSDIRVRFTGYAK